jgi:hypothetical protein
MITNEFLNWLKTAKGSDLAKYQTTNDLEKILIDAEIEKRLEANVPKILDNVFGFFVSLMNDDEESK